MFHIGHLNILKKAKALCDYLIVGVSTDELVREYKHKTPIIKFNERLNIVSSIKYVDKALAQTSMNKIDAWNNLHFDVMFHGSDWENSEMYNKIVEEFRQVGVDVIFLPHTPGTSSTFLKEALAAYMDKKGELC